ncbi:MAG: PASTA domain-containing protein, partial [Mycobacterium leprae]
GRYTAAPGLVGLDEQAATARAKQLGFAVRVAEPGYSETVRKGLVFDQSPDPGKRIAKSGTVAIHLSNGPERYAVPNLRGASFDDARRALAARKLRAGAVSYAYADDVPKDLVADAGPKAGTLVKPDTVVALVVSRGPQPVAVPDLTGADVADATRRLTALGLRVATVERTDEEIAKGTILEQTPAGETVLRGTTVRLVVSKGPPLFAVPNVVDLKTREAKARLKAAGFDPKVEDFPGGPNRILNQSPPAGSMQPRGTTIVIYAF